MNVTKIQLSRLKLQLKRRKNIKNLNDLDKKFNEEIIKKLENGINNLENKLLNEGLK